MMSNSPHLKVIMILHRLMSMTHRSNFFSDKKLQQIAQTQIHDYELVYV